jgi:hypothetical protein
MDIHAHEVMHLMPELNRDFSRETLAEAIEDGFNTAADKIYNH